MAEDDIGLDPASAYHIANLVVEAIDRLKSIDAIVPGAVARFVLSIDGQRFEVKIASAGTDEDGQ